jgi:hypothetical protein
MNKLEESIEGLSTEERTAKVEAIFATYDLWYFLNRGEELEYSDQQLESIFNDLAPRWISEHSHIVCPNLRTLKYKGIEIDVEEDELNERDEVVTKEDLENWLDQNFDFIYNFKVDKSEIEPL